MSVHISLCQRSLPGCQGVYYVRSFLPTEGLSELAGISRSTEGLSTVSATGGSDRCDADSDARQLRRISETAERRHSSRPGNAGKQEKRHTLRTA